MSYLPVSVEGPDGSPPAHGDVGRLATDIAAVRDSGWVYIWAGAHQFNDPEAALSWFLGSRPWHFSGSACVESVRPERAKEIVEAALEIDLAYRARAMPREEARGASERFIEIADGNSRWFTNVLSPDQRERDDLLGAWTPFTDHTFDICVAAVGPERLSIICIAAED